MRLELIAFFIFLPLYLFSQEEDIKIKSDFIITPEVMVGITAKSNEYFVNRGLQTGAIINFGWEQDKNFQEWAQRLNGPRTGLSIGYTDFGNKDSLGGAVTIMPFIEFKTFRKKHLKIQIGMGGSYFNKIYDSISNPNNRSVSTDLSFSFRAFLHYKLISGNNLDWRIGVGYFHHSNGHTRLPNQGLNSFLVSFSTDIKNLNNVNKTTVSSTSKQFTRRIYSYMSLRGGYGKNVLSRAFNDRKGVYSISGEYGRVLNNTFRLGVGFYYRFYQNYYNYIIDNESLVKDGEEFDFYKENPWRYATNFGLLASGEVLLNHVGIEGQIGFNLHKPGYKIAWRITEGWSYLPRIYPENAVLGEFNTNFKLKSFISARLGIKYYLLGTNSVPKNNVYFAFHINSNLGQAEFTELSLGYVYNFKFRER